MTRIVQKVQHGVQPWSSRSVWLLLLLPHRNLRQQNEISRLQKWPLKPVDTSTVICSLLSYTKSKGLDWYKSSSQPRHKEYKSWNFQYRLQTYILRVHCTSKPNWVIFELKLSFPLLSCAISKWYGSLTLNGRRFPADTARLSAKAKNDEN